MRRALLIFLAAFMMMTACARAGSDEISRAWRTAAIYVPGSAMPDGMEERGQVLAFRFTDENRGHSYEVLIERKSAAFLQRSLVALAPKGAKQVKLTADAIKEKVTRQYPDAAIDGVFARQEAGLYSYLVVFTRKGDSRLHRSLYNAQTGELLADMMWLVGPKEGLLTFSQAKKTAMSQMADAVLTDFQVDRAGGGVLYQVNLSRDGEERSISIDAKSGKILSSAARGAGRDKNRQQEPEDVFQAAAEKPAAGKASSESASSAPGKIKQASQKAVKEKQPHPLDNGKAKEKSSDDNQADRRLNSADREEDEEDTVSRLEEAFLGQNGGWEGENTD